MSALASIAKYGAVAIPVAAGLLFLKQRADRNRRSFPPTAKDIHVVPPPL